MQLIQRQFLHSYKTSLRKLDGTITGDVSRVDPPEPLSDLASLLSHQLLRHSGAPAAWMMHIYR